MDKRQISTEPSKISLTLHYSFPEKFCTTSPAGLLGQNFSGELYLAQIQQTALRLLLEAAAQVQVQDELEYTEALQIFAEVREYYWESWARNSQAFLWRLNGKDETAAQACLHVLSLSQTKMPFFEHQALTYLGDVRWAQGDVAAGEALYRHALTIQREANLHFRLVVSNRQLVAAAQAAGAPRSDLAERWRKHLTTIFVKLNRCPL